MTSIDTNILLFAYSEAAPLHGVARGFLEALSADDDVAVSEFVLAEFYLHLRNPSVLQRPLSAPAASVVIQEYRRHPCWQVIGCSPDSRVLHDDLWKLAGTAGFARRRLFDARLALTLIRQGVTEFATCNVRDFKDFGFTRVWNPLDEPGA